MIVVFIALSFFLQLFRLYLIHDFLAIFTKTFSLFCHLVMKEQAIRFRLIYLRLDFLYLTIDLIRF